MEKTNKEQKNIQDYERDIAFVNRNYDNASFSETFIEEYKSKLEKEKLEGDEKWRK